MKTKSNLKLAMCAGFLISTLSMHGQQDPNRSFFRNSMNLVNAAFVGSETAEIENQYGRRSISKSQVGIDFRSQWAGIEGGPETQSFFFATNAGKNVGLGLSVINDRTFIEEQTAITADFSYKVKVNQDTDLYFGIKAGATSYSANLAGLTTFGIEGDPSLQNLSGGFNPTFGVGVLLKGNDYYIALSTPNFITTDRLEDDEGTARLGSSRTHYHLAASYNIKLGRTTILKPAAIARYVEAAPTSVEVNALVSLDNKIELGPTYRFNESVGGLFIINAANWADVGYAYEVSSNNPISFQSGGTHEIFLKFNL